MHTRDASIAKIIDTVYCLDVFLNKNKAPAAPADTMMA